MESELYKSIIAKGEARGEARGEAKLKAETIIRILTYRIGILAPAVREHIRKFPDAAVLGTWYDAALHVVDMDGAQRLMDTIRNTPILPLE